MLYQISCRTKSPNRPGSNVCMNVHHIAVVKDSRGVANTYIVGIRADGQFQGNVIALKASRLRKIVLSEVDAKQFSPEGWWFSQPSDVMAFLEQVIEEDRIFLDDDAVLLKDAIVDVSIFKALGLPEPTPTPAP